jgi:hypothetical protein
MWIVVFRLVTSAGLQPTFQRKLSPPYALAEDEDNSPETLVTTYKATLKTGHQQSPVIRSTSTHFSQTLSVYVTG